MFYDFTSNITHKGLFKSCIIPRPIAWVSSISPGNITNLAPFSYFQAVCDVPPMIMFVSSPKDKEGNVKDTVKNIEATKEFVINIVTEESKDLMMLTSNPLPYNESEIDKYGIETKKSILVKPPSVVISPINMECKYVKTIQIENNQMIIGEIIGISVDDKFLFEEKIDTKKLRLFSRLGYSEYALIDKVVSIQKK